MQVEKVTAIAFGPLRDTTLELAPGLTVIVGPNEAGKSTWHAAIRSGIAGIRRGRGRPSSEDESFALLHQPWDQPLPWEVEVVLRLDDGRRVEVRQDLGSKTASRATDIDLGTDISSEIMSDGSPDASVWLGLDRDVFTRTICIDQAEILKVTGAAGSLQEQMQRAAATHKSDTTAAAAIARLNTFLTNAVGSDRAPTRPLVTERKRKQDSTLALESARRQHGEYLALRATADGARVQAQAARVSVRIAEARQARTEADTSTQTLERARQLDQLHQIEPAGLPARDMIADDVASALAGWDKRPVPAVLSGTDSAAIEAELTALPGPPGGDTTPAVEVIAASDARRAAIEARSLLGTRPVVPVAPFAGGLSEADVRRLVEDLDVQHAPVDAALAARLGDAKARRQSQLRWLPIAVVGAGVALLVSVIAAIASFLPVTITGLIVAAAFGLWAIDANRRQSVSRDEVAAAESSLAPQQTEQAAAERRHDEALRRAANARVPSSSRDLAQLADALAAWTAADREAQAWDARWSESDRRVRTSDQALRQALVLRAVDVGDDVGAALAAYETACRSAMAQSSESAKATGLRRALVARQESEQARDKAQEQVVAEERRLRDTAASAGLGRDGDPPSLVAGLRAWQAKRGATIKEGQRSLLEWQELQGILGGRTLVDLVREADEKALRASRLAEGLGARPPDADGATAGEPDLDTLHRVADELAERANRLDGQCGNAESQLAAVPEAEEAVQRAQDEVARLERLRDTLTRTVEILDAAQARVHRDLAPVLGAALRVNLASVTGGRYVDAAVNPGDLVVKVKETAALGGHWRSAQTLSRGTREQVYLLLRAAMAQYLVTKDERAPLLLDEVTAQSDAVRTAAVLSVLHRISADRQVILFSHDATVGAWAREHLGDRDRLVTLAVQGTPA